MKILVFGAGVIGSIYAGCLARAGHSVTLLARGDRLTQLRSKGLILDDVGSGESCTAPVTIASSLDQLTDLDLLVVAVRDGQIPAILSMLDPFRPRFGLLFLANCPLRIRHLTDRFGTDRAAFGFPGAGGVISDQTVSYFRVRQQPTTFGPVLGQSSLKANELAQLFAAAGFATAVVADMEAWLKTHAFLIAAICGALYQNGGLSMKLAAHRPSLRLLRRGFREGLACVRALGFTPSPLKLRLLGDTLPEWIVIPILARLFSSPMATFAIDGHANAAIDDMHDLALDCRLMLKQSGVAAPDMQQLCALVDAAARQKLAGAGENQT